MPNAHCPLYTPPMPTPRKKGRTLFWCFIALWAIALVGVYYVVVKLKLGGTDGIREKPESHSTGV